MPQELTPETADKVVDTFSQAALGLVPWTDALRVGAQAMGATKAHIMGVGTMLTEEALHFAWNLTPDYWQPYVEHYHKHDIWVPATESKLGVRTRATVSDTVLGPEVHRDYLRSEIYNDLSKYQEVVHFCTFEDRNPGFGASGGGIRLGVFNDLRGGFFSDRHLSLMTRLMSSVPMALCLAERRIASQKTGMAALNALDQLSDAIVLVDGSLNILHANDHARAIMESEYWHRRSGTETCLSGSLRGLFPRVGPDEAFLIPERRSVLLRTGHSRAYAIQLLPLPKTVAQFAGKATAAFALVMRRLDGNPANILWNLFAERFKTTPSELRIAKHICEGRSLGDAAVRFNVSAETTRTHMKALLRKTATASQAELVMLVLKSFSTIFTELEPGV